MIQTRSEIENALTERIEAVTDWIANQPDDRFEFAPSEKWTTGQHLEHLIRSTKAVGLAIRLPKFVLKLRFGTANRPSRSYDETIARYQAALASGGAASGRFVPPAIPVDKKQSLIKQYRNEATRFVNVLHKWREEDLDKYIVPHPLIGKLTLREILFFTVYHNQHHLETLRTHY